MGTLLLITILLQQPAPAARPTPAAPATSETPVAPAENNPASPVPAAPADNADDAWVQEARDWLIAVRVAYDKMTPAQTRALAQSFENLSPAALRVLVTVYEHTYGVQSPLSAADLRPPNETEAEREWIMAYRILYDRLSLADARAYAETLRSMTPNQIRALLGLYEEKNRQRAEAEALRTAGTSSSETPTADTPPPEPSPGETMTPDQQAAARRALAEAQQRMEFERESRQMALGRARGVRADTKQSMVAANSTTAVTAAAENARLRRQEDISQAQAMQHNSFQNYMYDRNIRSPGYSSFYFFPGRSVR